MEFGKRLTTVAMEGTIKTTRQLDVKIERSYVTCTAMYSMTSQENPGSYSVNYEMHLSDLISSTKPNNLPVSKNLQASIRPVVAKNTRGYTFTPLRSKQGAQLSTETTPCVFFSLSVYIVTCESLTCFTFENFHNFNSSPTVLMWWNVGYSEKLL